MVRYLILLAVVGGLLSGCAGNRFKEYAGQDIREVMIDYGEPVNAFDMPDGRRAFQWVLNTSYRTPTRIITHQDLDDPGDPRSWVTQQTMIFGGERVESTCLYTLMTRWDESIDGWRVLREDPARVTCQR